MRLINLVIQKYTKNQRDEAKVEAKSFLMVSSGHLLSFASFPVPLPLPMSEKLNIKRVSINILSKRPTTSPARCLLTSHKVL